MEGFDMTKKQSEFVGVPAELCINEIERQGHDCFQILDTFFTPEGSGKGMFSKFFRADKIMSAAPRQLITHLYRHIAQYTCHPVE